MGSLVPFPQIPALCSRGNQLTLLFPGYLKYILEDPAIVTALEMLYEINILSKAELNL